MMTTRGSLCAALLLAACESELTLSFTPQALPAAATQIVGCMMISLPDATGAPRSEVYQNSLAWEPNESTLQVLLPSGASGTLYLEARNADGDCGVLATASAPISGAVSGERPLRFDLPPPFALAGAASLCRVEVQRDPSGLGLGRFQFCDPDAMAPCATPVGMPAGCPAGDDHLAYYVPRGGAIAIGAQGGGSSHFGGWVGGGGCSSQGARCLLSGLSAPKLAPLAARFDPGTCASAHLCWESPLPQGNTLNGALLRDSEAWVVGESGAALRHAVTAPATTPGWMVVPSTGADLFAVAGGAGGVWASGEGGQILQAVDGVLRQAAGSQITNERLYSLSAALPDQVWTAGNNGAVVRGQLLTTPVPHWEWSSVLVQPGRPQLRQVVVNAAGRALAVATSGTLLAGDAAGLTAAACATESLFGLLPGGEQDPLYVVGARGGIWRRDPQGLCRPVRPPDPELPALRAIAADEIGSVVVGDRGTVLRARRGEDAFAPVAVLDASDAAPAALPALNAVHLTPAGGLIVGSGGVMLRLRDGAWRREEVLGVPVAPLLNLNAISGARRDQLYAVGEAGVIMRWQAGRWSRDNNPDDPPRDLYGAASDGAVTFAVGVEGAVLWRSTTDGWQVDQTKGLPRRKLYAVALSDTHVIVAGEWDDGAGTAAWWRPRASGAPWQALVLGSEKKTLFALWARADQMCVGGSVGVQGGANVLCARRDRPGDWLYQKTGSEATVYGLWGSGPADLWAAGFGVLLYRGRADASAWAPVPGPSGVLRAGASVGAHVVVAGDDGTVWRRAPPSGAFTQVMSGTRKNLRGALALAPDDLLFVGDQGAVLRYIP